MHFGRGLAARKYFTYGDPPIHLRPGQVPVDRARKRDDVAEGRRKALAFIEGRSTAELVGLGEEIYDEIIVDKIWPGTRALAQMHLDAGQQVWLVTATPFELAETIAKRLGFTGALGTTQNPSTASSPDGWSARSRTVPAKPTRCAHSPSARPESQTLHGLARTATTTLPMLSLVGTAVAINPRRRPA